MLKRFALLATLLVAGVAHAQIQPGRSLAGIAIIKTTSPIAFNYEYPTPTPFRTTQANQTVTVSGTFSLEHSLSGSTNDDAPWDYPYSTLNSHPEPWENVAYSISAGISQSGTYYWARLVTQCWDGDEIFDLTYTDSPIPERVTRHALWYDRGSNSVIFKTSN